MWDEGGKSGSCTIPRRAVCGSIGSTSGATCTGSISVEGRGRLVDGRGTSVEGGSTWVEGHGTSVEGASVEGRGKSVVGGDGARGISSVEGGGTLAVHVYQMLPALEEHQMPRVLAVHQTL